jgi:carbon monoxide dehydrogenase subunit G
MRLSNEIVVPAAPADAFAVLLDLERIAPCLPGARVEAAGGGEYRGTMAVKLGPISSRFEGTLRIDEADEPGRRAVLSARARDSRGQGTAAATITSTMEPADGGTRVVVDTDLRVTGPVASFGRGVMQDVSARLMSQFAECLAAEVARARVAPSSGAAADGVPGAEPTRADAGVALASALPPDVPAPPPGGGGVRWPDGVMRAPGELPQRVEPPAPEVLDLGEAGREAIFALARRALPTTLAVGVVLVAVAHRRRRRR